MLSGNELALQNYLAELDRNEADFNEYLAEVQDYLNSAESIKDFAEYFSDCGLTYAELLEDGMSGVWEVLHEWLYEVADLNTWDDLFENLDLSNLVAFITTQSKEVQNE